MILFLTGHAWGGVILPMNKLSRAARAHIIRLLVEGSSMRSVSRIADVSINTVTKLLIDAGKICSVYQDQALRNLPCNRPFETSRVSGSSSMRFGHFHIANSGKSHLQKRPRKTLATFGLGLRSMPIQSSFPPGASAIGAARLRLSSSAIYRGALQTGFRSQAMGTAPISKL